MVMVMIMVTAIGIFGVDMTVVNGENSAEFCFCLPTGTYSSTYSCDTWCSEHSWEVYDAVSFRREPSSMGWNTVGPG